MNEELAVSNVQKLVPKTKETREIAPSLDKFRETISYYFPHLRPSSVQLLQTAYRALEPFTKKPQKPEKISRVVEANTPWEDYLYSLERKDRKTITLVEGLTLKSTDIIPRLVTSMFRWYADHQETYHNQPLNVLVEDHPKKQKDPRRPVKRDKEGFFSVVLIGPNGEGDIVRLPEKWQKLEDTSLVEQIKMAVSSPHHQYKRRVKNWQELDTQPGVQMVIDLGWKERQTLTSAWEAHLLAKGAWIGVQIDEKNKLNISFDHLVLDGKASFDAVNALVKDLPKTKNGQEKVSKPKSFLLTRKDDPNPILKIEIPSNLNFRTLTKIFAESIAAAGLGYGEKFRNPTTAVPVVPEQPPEFSPLHRRIAIATVPFQTSEGPINEPAIKKIIADTRRQEFRTPMESLFKILYSPRIPKKIQTNLSSIFARLSSTKEIVAAFNGNGLISMIQTKVDSQEYFENHLPLYGGTIKPKEEIGGGVVCTIHEVVFNDPSAGERKATRHASLSGSGKFGSADKLQGFAGIFKDKMERE